MNVVDRNSTKTIEQNHADTAPEPPESTRVITNPAQSVPRATQQITSNQIKSTKTTSDRDHGIFNNKNEEETGQKASKTHHQKLIPTA
jgi:hypothetical protein